MKNNKVNGFLVAAIVVVFFLLCATVYGGYLIFGMEEIQCEPNAYSVASIDDIVTDDDVESAFYIKTMSTITGTESHSAFGDIPSSLIPDLLSCSAATGISIKHIGFVMYTDHPKLLAVGISSGLHKGAIILPTDYNVAVLSPAGLFIEEEIAWNRRDYPNLLPFLRSDRTKVAYTDDVNIFESLKFDAGGNITWKTDDFSMAYSAGSLTYTPKADLMTRLQKNSIIPTMPPYLYMGIATLLLLIGGILLWKIKSYDMSIACFALIPAMVMVGGMSLYLVMYGFYIPSTLLPMTAFIFTGLAWSIPLVLLWVALGAERALGLFWLSFGILFTVTILDKLFPFVWLVAIGVITILVIISAILVPSDNRQIRL